MKKPVFTVWHWSSVKVLLSHWNRYTLCFDPVPVKDKAGPVQTNTDASLFHCSAVWCYETLSAQSETWDCSLRSEAEFKCTQVTKCQVAMILNKSYKKIRETIIYFTLKLKLFYQPISILSSLSEFSWSLATTYGWCNKDTVQTHMYIKCVKLYFMKLNCHQIRFNTFISIYTSIYENPLYE